MRGYNLLHVTRYYDILENIKLYKERYSLVCQSLQQSQISSSIRGLHSGVIPMHAIGQIEVTMSLMLAIAEKASEDCIKRYGKMLMALFQRVITFIIEMKTRSIMLLKTSNVYQSQTTTLTTFQPIQKRKGRGVESGLIAFAKQHLIGMVQKKVKRGMVNLGAWLGNMSSTRPMFVTIVGMNINQEQLILRVLDSALTSAKQHHAVNQEWMTSNEYVLNAEESLQSTNIAMPNIAPTYALNKCEEVKRQRIYISVDPVGDDFPIGIFIYDEDQSRYIVARFDLKPTTVRYSSRIY